MLPYQLTEEALMIEITLEECNHTTFPDARVLNFDLDLDKKICTVALDSSHVGGNSNKIFGATELTISNWDEISILEWDGEKMSNVIEPLEDYKLKDICENSFEENLVLKGFNIGHGFWTIYTFSRGDIEIRVDVDQFQ